MNKDQMKGTFNELKGKTKEKIGELVGDRRTQAEGVGDRIKGKVQSGIGNMKEQVHRGVEKLEKKSSELDRPERDSDFR